MKNPTVILTGVVHVNRHTFILYANHNENGMSGLWEPHYKFLEHYNIYIYTVIK